MKKNELRRRIYDRRDRLTSGEITEKSTAIAANLYSMPVYEKSDTIMFFLSFRSEVETRPMVEQSIASGKRVLVPKSIPAARKLVPCRLLDWDKELAPGAYGIPEPREEAMRITDPREIELLLVPGVAFDEAGNRLGYGGGYYDRFFPRLRESTPLVALVFELQIMPAVPVASWDRPVDYIVTESRIIRGRC